MVANSAGQCGVTHCPGAAATDLSPMAGKVTSSASSFSSQRAPEGSGKIGLTNLGNSCFMNAGLQCLCHLDLLSNYFLSGRYEAEVNVDNPLGCKGELARSFASFLRAYWQQRSGVFNPRELRQGLARCAPHLFEGGEQQDVQEFLAFCLDGLHEDLNRVRCRKRLTEEELAEDERLARERGEEFAAALAWYRHLERDKSFLVDLLQGQLRSSLTCSCCGYRAGRFDPFLYLSLPVSRTMSAVTQALDAYNAQEELRDDEQWYCPRCEKKVDATKKIDLWKLPPVLVLHLKRFEFDQPTMSFTKTDNRLHLKLSELDLSAFCASPQRDGAIYDVMGSVNHSGSYGSGHYTAMCRVGGPAGTWHHFNDGICQEVTGRNVVTKDTYMIFLVRRGAPEKRATSRGKPSIPRGLLRQQSVTMPQNWPHASDLVQEVLDMVIAERVPSSPEGGQSAEESTTASPPGKRSAPADDASAGAREGLAELAAGAGADVGSSAGALEVDGDSPSAVAGAGAKEVAAAADGMGDSSVLLPVVAAAGLADSGQAGAARTLDAGAALLTSPSAKSAVAETAPDSGQQPIKRQRTLREMFGG